MARSKRLRKKSKRIKKIYQADGNQKKAGVAILISAKISEQNFIIMKRSILNIYALNNRTPKYMKLK